MSKKLVAFFSASGVTAKLAETFSKAANADLFEIIPSKPYTAADLDWTNKESRSTLEMKDKNSRPEISNKVENMDEYDTIYIGFPIWWYVAPTIINTFLESYNLKGKTVVPFASSGGSGMGKTNENLLPSCPGAVLKAGKKFSANASAEEIKSWIESI